MKIVFIISSLGAGGAERVATTICNAWAEIGHKVTIITFDDEPLKPFYKLDSAIKLFGLGVLGVSRGFTDAIFRNFSTIRRIRQHLRQIDPDCVVSFMDTTNVKTLLATLGLSIPTIVSERTDPSQQIIARPWRLMRRITYSWAKLIVVQTTEALNFFPKKIQQKIIIIPNPVLLGSSSILSPDITLSGNLKIVGMGRLSSEKRFDLLIRAFGQIHEKHGATLIILGEGPLRQELIALRDRLGLTNIVNFSGQIKNPFSVIKQANIFVLSSEYEGFPNSLLEAMACGIAVISFDCPSGPRNIIRHGVDGLLVPPLDVEGLANAIDRLLSDDTERRRLAQNALEVRNKYALDKIMEMWNRAIMIAGSKQGTS